MTRGGAGGAPDENVHRAAFCHSLRADLLHGRVVARAGDLRARLARLCAVLQSGPPACPARLPIPG